MSWSASTRTSIGLASAALLAPSIFGITAPFTVNATTPFNWDLTARARVGYAYDNWLLYATGGLVLIGAKTDSTGAFGVNPCVTLALSMAPLQASSALIKS